MTRAHLLSGTSALIATFAAMGIASGAAAQTGNAPTAPTAPSAQADNAATSTGSSGGSADIVVTARKRDERLLDVPISVQAFGRAEIKAAGILDLQTLKDRAGFQLPPQVSNGPAGRFTGILIFRGLQANSFGQQRDNSGSLFVDGIYVSGGVQSVNTSDVERIEVLKGPQTAYFGRSTFGGAVNFITRNPSQKLGGELNVRVTARGNVDADASIEGALVPDVLSVRLTGYTHDKAAQYRATDGGKLGAEESRGATATVYITPTSNSFIRVRGKYQTDEDSAPSFAFLPANTYAAGACTGRTFNGFNQLTGAGPITLARNYFCNGVPSLDSIGTGIITQNTIVPPEYAAAIALSQAGGGTLNVPFFTQVPKLQHFGLKRDTYFVSAQAGYTFDDGAALALNVGYNQQDTLDINDVDKTDTLFGFLDTVAFRTQDLTIDGRFSTDPTKRIRALIGGSYFHGKTQLSDLQYNAFGPAPSRGTNFTDERAETPAVYGSIDFDILSNLTVTAEGRYQEDKITAYNIAGVKTAQQTFKNFLPRGILRFKPSGDTSIYVSYAKGTQPAGINSGFAGLSALPFATEATAYVRSIYPGIGLFSLLPTLDAYEAGIKQKLFDGRVSYTLAIYQNDWHNATTTSALFNPASCFAGGAQTSNTAACPLGAGGTSTVTPNEARIRGVEFAVNARVSDAFSVDLTADYKDPKWLRYANSGFNAFAGLTTPGSVYRGDGNSLGRVPNLSGTLSGTYRGSFGDKWHWYARGDALYTGKAWDSDLNIFKTPDYVRVNASIGVQFEHVTVELFSTNLFNDKHFDGVANTVALTGDFTQRALAVIPAQKREFGLRTQFKF